MSELCFNLWYFLTPGQTISGIAARAYLLDGSEDEKAEILRALSNSDFRLLPVRPLPVKIMRRFQAGAVPYGALADVGVEAIYEDIFLEIRRGIAPAIPFPDDKPFFATPLYDFGEGFVPVEIGDGYMRER